MCRVFILREVCSLSCKVCPKSVLKIIVILLNYKGFHGCSLWIGPLGWGNVGLVICLKGRFKVQAW